MTADIRPGQCEKKGINKKDKQTGDVYTTVFYIPEEAAVEVSRILDILRSKSPPKIDPQIAKDEGKDLWGNDSVDY